MFIINTLPYVCLGVFPKLRVGLAAAYLGEWDVSLLVDDRLLLLLHGIVETLSNSPSSSVFYARARLRGLIV